MIDGVDQYVLLFANQVTVVAGALVGLVLGAVEVAYLPVQLADPVNVVFNVNSHEVDRQDAIVNVRLELASAAGVPTFNLLFLLKIFLLNCH
ncbi:hypothetical protein D3C76_1361240 [compost metagenome]